MPNHKDTVERYIQQVAPSIGKFVANVIGTKRVANWLVKHKSISKHIMLRVECVGCGKQAMAQVGKLPHNFGVRYSVDKNKNITPDLYCEVCSKKLAQGTMKPCHKM
jgi:hypothetical protein